MVHLEMASSKLVPLLGGFSVVFGVLAFADKIGKPVFASGESMLPMIKVRGANALSRLFLVILRLSRMAICFG